MIGIVTRLTDGCQRRYGVNDLTELNEVRAEITERREKVTHVSVWHHDVPDEVEANRLRQSFGLPLE